MQWPMPHHTSGTCQALPFSFSSTQLIFDCLSPPGIYSRLFISFRLISVMTLAPPFFSQLLSKLYKELCTLPQHTAVITPKMHNFSTGPTFITNKRYSPGLMHPPMNLSNGCKSMLAFSFLGTVPPTTTLSKLHQCAASWNPL